jgi:hypothetical protein
MINEINGYVIILGCMVMHVSAGWILEEAQPRTQGLYAGNLGGSHWRNQSRDMVALVTYWRSTRSTPVRMVGTLTNSFRFFTQKIIFCFFLHYSCFLILLHGWDVEKLIHAYAMYVRTYAHAQ